MAASNTRRTSVTPPQYARRIGVSPAKVRGWIERRELGAVNVASSPGGKRPRYVITEQDIQRFEASRRVGGGR